MTPIRDVTIFGEPSRCGPPTNINRAMNISGIKWASTKVARTSHPLSGHFHSSPFRGCPLCPGGDSPFSPASTHPLRDVARYSYSVIAVPFIHGCDQVFSILYCLPFQQQLWWAWYAGMRAISKLVREWCSWEQVFPTLCRPNATAFYCGVGAM